MYPSVKYNGNGEKIKIFCPKDEHGEFEQTPANHKTGHGCPKCATETRKISNIMSFHLFVEKANKIHNKYEYSSLDYNGVKKDICIICPIHGEFSLMGSSHLNGQGCRECSRLNKSKLFKKDINHFMNISNKIHNNYYDYSQSIYINNSTKLNIICPVHGIFSQLPSNHSQGAGCRKCNPVGGWNRDRFKGLPTILYYICIDKKYFKIGITSRSIEERFRNDILKGVNIQVLYSKTYVNGQDAFDAELEIKNMFKSFAYNGPKLISSGNSEIFTENVLQF